MMKKEVGLRLVLLFLDFLFLHLCLVINFLYMWINLVLQFLSFTCSNQL